MRAAEIVYSVVVVAFWALIVFLFYKVVDGIKKMIIKRKWHRKTKI